MTTLGVPETMPIRDLFQSDVTRDIPPVVYFHEQSADKLQSEVSEYIITGGWPDGHPNHRRVPSGIHEQYVSLLTAITAELDKPGGPDLPNAWISGFYGSGKSSFAKLLGLALDGAALPAGASLAEAWLRRDTSPKADRLRAAWDALRRKVDPLAVVFDIGGVARNNEQVHAAALRQVQRRLGYCASEPLVADFELKLERDGHWARFEDTARRVLGQPWSDFAGKALAEDAFSQVLHAMFPERYLDPTDWFLKRGGTHERSESPEEAAAAIRDMLLHRRRGATLFLVIDEVSQYVLSNKDRVDRLRAFATALGSTLRGKAWLLALGQQKLDEDAGDSFLDWAKDRFPPRLRVHLAATNIRDVVHKRLLQKKPAIEPQLRALFDSYRPDLKLYGYACENITQDEFVETYPMLPGHIDLLLQITSALRLRSTRAQGDDQAIRGLLQLLGELFRGQRLADQPVGALVTLDQVYDVQHTALDSDVQASMARILSQCADDEGGLLVRAAKAVALLELLQDTQATDARLVAQALYDRLDLGNRLPQITDALEELRRRNLLAYSEKQGYKIQSSAGEEWERERREVTTASREARSALVEEALKFLLSTLERPALKGRGFPFRGLFSDGRRPDDAILVDPRDPAAFTVSFQLRAADERGDALWIKRSGESAFRNQLLWVAGDSDRIDALCKELTLSRAMVRKYQPRRESLNPARKLLLQQEEIRGEDLEPAVREAVAAAWMAGRFYFRDRPVSPLDYGPTFATALHAAATRLLPGLFPHLIALSVSAKELAQLVAPEIGSPSPKFMADELGLLELDGGRYVPACSGVVPQRVQAFIEAEAGVSGAALLAHFGAPPYGYTDEVIKACVAVLLRGSRLRVQPEGGVEITAVRDPGAADLFDKDRPFRRATLAPAGDDDVGFQSRVKICKFFEERLQHRMEREDDAIANAVALRFPPLSQRLRDVTARLGRLPGAPRPPAVLDKLAEVLEECVRSCRQTRPTVKLVKRHLDALRDGVQLLNRYDAELSAEALQAVRVAASVRDHQAAQLRAAATLDAQGEAAAARIEEQLHAERPWQDVAALQPALEALLQRYGQERRQRLAWQETQAEAARGRLKARAGFTTLTADQAHSVLRPIAQAGGDAAAAGTDAVAPTLLDLQDPFLARLARAEEEANERLDEILSEGHRPLVVRVDLGLRGRELASAADLDAFLEELRSRLGEHLRGGARVRLA